VAKRVFSFGAAAQTTGFSSASMVAAIQTKSESFKASFSNNSAFRCPNLPGELRVDTSTSLGIFSVLAERRYAKQASKELLELFYVVRNGQPELSGRALYEAVIARRLGANQKRAGEIVRRAEESFTDWPSDRDLRFRHVVHYQVFDEFTHSGPGRENTRTNMGTVVARIIPEEL
jgi:hypothetical protein